MIKSITPLLSGVIIGIIGSVYILQQKPKEIQYIQGDRITDTIEKPVPYEVVIPSNPIYIYKKIVDTVLISNVDTIIADQIVDTASIIAEFIQLKKYRQNLFDSTGIGKLDVSIDVQYNAIQSIGYSFYRHIPVIKKKNYTPFIQGLSGSHASYVGLGGGIIIDQQFGLGATIMADRTMQFNAFFVFK